MKLILTEAALDDLRSIRDYTLETWGAEQEEHYLNKL
jgi:plasmid stabilization system protein ParE